MQLICLLNQEQNTPLSSCDFLCFIFTQMNILMILWLKYTACTSESVEINLAISSLSGIY